jgi:hypothetical protein
VHSFSDRIEASMVAARDWRADFHDPLFFRRLVLSLVENDIHVCIASFGKFEVIKAYMDLLFAADEFKFDRETISTPSQLPGYSDGMSVQEGKNKQLLRLSNAFGVDLGTTLFVDGAASLLSLMSSSSSRCCHCRRQCWRWRWRWRWRFRRFYLLCRRRVM